MTSTRQPGPGSYGEYNGDKTLMVYCPSDGYGQIGAPSFLPVPLDGFRGISRAPAGWPRVELTTAITAACYQRNGVVVKLSSTTAVINTGAAGFRPRIVLYRAVVVVVMLLLV